MEAGEQVVAVLVGERFVDMALECLGSLQRYSAEKFVFQVHDDGTLTSAGRRRLEAKLRVGSFVPRSEADRAVEERLEKFPRCREFRRQSVLALKLFDVPLLHPQETVAFCDSDIRFFRPVTGLFHLPSPSCDFVFMQDRVDAYSLRPWDIAAGRSLELASCLNTGWMLFRRAVYDLASVESFLGRNLAAFVTRPMWLEQTCWAATAKTGRVRLWDPAQMLVPRGRIDLSPLPVAAHFTSSIRGLLPAAVELDRPEATVEEMKTIAARPLGGLQFARQEIWRWMQKRLAARA